MRWTGSAFLEGCVQVARVLPVQGELCIGSLVGELVTSVDVFAMSWVVLAIRKRGNYSTLHRMIRVAQDLEMCRKA